MSFLDSLFKPNVGKLEAKQDIDGLIKALQYKNTSDDMESGNIRQAAAMALGHIRDGRAVESLLVALKDRKWYVRHAATQALGDIRDSRSVEPLLVALIQEIREATTVATGDWWNPEAIAEALGQIKDKRAVEPLGIVAQSLGEMDDERRVKPLVAITRTLGKIGDAHAIKPLITVLYDKNTDIRRAAMDALKKIGQPVSKSLVEVLKDDNAKWDIREEVAEVLGEFKDASAVDPLIGALRYFQGGTWDVQRAAVKALGQIGDARAVEPLISALKSSNYIVRWRAAEALGKIGDNNSIEPLIAVLQDKEQVVWEAALKSLAKFERDAFGCAAIDSLIAVLNDESLWPDIGKTVAAILGKIRDKRTVEPLISILMNASRYPSVRTAVAKALGQIGDTRAVESLNTAQNERNPDLRRAARNATNKLAGKSQEQQE